MKTIFRTKNLKLLVKRLEDLLDSPTAAQFNMHHFGSEYKSSMAGVLVEFPPICGTQACLAGETVIATGTGKFQEGGGIVLADGAGGWSILFQAQKDLGLTKAQSNKLFFFGRMLNERGNNLGWPTQFEEAYDNAKTPQGRLYVAIRRVEHFIKTRGRE